MALCDQHTKIWNLIKNPDTAAAVANFFSVHRWQYQFFIEHEIEIFAVNTPPTKIECPPLAPKCYL